MSIERAADYLKKYNLDSEILEFDTSSATVELAAKAIGTLPERIAKSLSFKLGEKAILIVAAGDVKIDNRKFKDHFKQKARMLKPDEVKELIGHEIGGVCPFGVNEGVDIYLDESLREYESVYPACGSQNSAIHLSISKLAEIVDYVDWIDVTKK